MSNIIVPGLVECPLCLKPMRKFFTPNGIVYACLGPNCLVSINGKDPVVNKWYMKKPPPCAVCGKPMRAFFRSLDRFLKCQCPNCLSKGKLVQVVRGEVTDIDPRWSVDA